MSAIVQQLSYNINEKLCLDDRTFSFEQHHNHNAEAKSTPKISTSFSTKEPSGQWVSPTSAPSPPYTVPTSSTATTSFPTLDEKPFTGVSGTVVGVACHRSTRRPTVTPTLFPKSQQGEHTLTTLHDLHENSAHRFPKSFSGSLNKPEKWHGSLSHKSSNFAPDFNLDEHKLSTVSELQQSEIFPSIIGRSCTLHSPKKSILLPLSNSSSTITDIPPNKRHCRSVSEPNDLLDASSSSHSISPSLLSWKPTPQSRVWVPIKKLRQSSRRAYSARTSGSSSGVFHNCSRSLDGASINSGSSATQDSPLTPPASPIPRPASVTVIKQEGGAWTFLSSQHTLYGHYQKTSFSPLSSPCYNPTSPSSSTRITDSQCFVHPSLSATKRSLSFSEDFDHRESIEYTPTSTPELDRRYFHSTQKGGLARCRSHPCDLNLKKFRSRRKHGGRHARPTLDFAKMKQTIKVETATNWSSLTGGLGQIKQINPVFPSLINSESPRKKQVLQPITSASPQPSDVRFSMGVGDSPPTRHVPTTPPVTSDTEDVITHMDEVARTSSGSVPNFIRDCNDLDLNLIENDDSDLED